MEIKTQIGILTRLSHALAEALDSGVKTDTEETRRHIYDGDVLLFLESAIGTNAVFKADYINQERHAQFYQELMHVDEFMVNEWRQHHNGAAHMLCLLVYMLERHSTLQEAESSDDDFPA